MRLISNNPIIQLTNINLIYVASVVSGQKYIKFRIILFDNYYYNSNLKIGDIVTFEYLRKNSKKNSHAHIKKQS